MTARWRKLNKTYDIDNRIYGETIASFWGRATVQWAWIYSKHDEEMEQKIITAMDTYFAYPRYSDIAGEKSKSDSLARKAQLLLIGEFEWNGWVIAKSNPLGTRDEVGWMVNLAPDYKPKAAFDIAYKDTGEPIVDEYGSRRLPSARFRPFANTKKEFIKPLASVLYPAEEGRRTIVNGCNLFDLSPQNIAFVSRSGRPNKCVKCGREKLPENLNKIVMDQIEGKHCDCCIRDRSRKLGMK